MSVVIGLYGLVRAVPRVRKRFFFEGGGSDFRNFLRSFGEFMLEHQSKRNCMFKHGLSEEENACWNINK